MDGWTEDGATEDAETDGSRLMKTEKEEKEVGRKGEIGEGCRSRSPRFSLLSHKSTLAAMPHLRQTELCCPLLLLIRGIRWPAHLATSMPKLPPFPPPPGVCKRDAAVDLVLFIQRPPTNWHLSRVSSEYLHAFMQKVENELQHKKSVFRELHSVFA